VPPGWNRPDNQEVILRHSLLSVSVGGQIHVTAHEFLGLLHGIATENGVTEHAQVKQFDIFHVSKSQVRHVATDVIHHLVEMIMREALATAQLFIRQAAAIYRLGKQVARFVADRVMQALQPFHNDAAFLTLP
jgi:purine-nucleoside phosphorylase